MDFAYRAITDRVAESFVDIMRLLTVRYRADILAANGHLYEAFAQTAQEHLADLRSHIEGAATALDPHTHEMARRIERRLTWCLAQLRAVPEEPDRPTEVWDLVRSVSTLAVEIVNRDGDGHLDELSAARAAVAAVDSDDFVWRRLSAQTRVLELLREGRTAITSIGADVDHDFAVPYFLIDAILLESVSLDAGA